MFGSPPLYPSPPPPPPPPPPSSPPAALAIVRPFATHDASKLIGSFARWEVVAPCAAVGAGFAPAPPLVLYYSKSIRELQGTPAWPSLEAFLQGASSKPWRRCFGSVSLLGGNLTEAQHRYTRDTAGSEIAWSSGPSVQFYRMLAYYSARPETTTVYYMGPDSVPMWRLAEISPP